MRTSYNTSQLIEFLNDLSRGRTKRKDKCDENLKAVPLHPSNREKGTLQKLLNSLAGSGPQLSRILKIKDSSNIYHSNLDPLNCKIGVPKY